MVVVEEEAVNELLQNTMTVGDSDGVNELLQMTCRSGGMGGGDVEWVSAKWGGKGAGREARGGELVAAAEGLLQQEA